MEEVAAVRGAALEAVGDIEPDRLCDRIRGRLEGGSMAPGVLTLLSARAAHEHASDPPEAFSVDAVAERGAGVQLIYEGLRLTRTLSQDPPWEREDAPDSGPDDGELTDGGDVTVSDTEGSDPIGGDAAMTGADAADMDILVADVMVSRGFYLLARTDAAAEAVAVVQSFGTDQTQRRTTGDETLDGNLEVDVFELAVVAGTTAGGVAPTPEIREYAAEMGRIDGPLPEAERLFSEATTTALSEFFADEAAGGVPPSTD